MHLCAELTASFWTLEPFGEIGANFSLQLSSRTRFDKINKKTVIAENQCEKHKKIEFKRQYETNETETAFETEQFRDINDKNIQVEFPIACTHQFSTEVIKSSDQIVPLEEEWWGFIVFAAMIKINCSTFEYMQQTY